MSVNTLRRSAVQWLQDAVPSGFVVTSDGLPAHGLTSVPNSKDRFFQLTGTTDNALRLEWKSGVTRTTCNAFIAKYTLAMQLGNLNDLNVHDQLKKWGRKDAWVHAAPGTYPLPGDVVMIKHAGHFHVCATLDRTGDKWTSVDGGQGGYKYELDGKGNKVKDDKNRFVLQPGGHDVIKRVVRDPYSKVDVIGWVDIDLLLAGSRPRYQETLTMRDLWLNDDGRLVHPDAPAGRGGPGGSRPAGPLGQEASSLTALWHPDAPANLHLGPWDELDHVHGLGA